MIDRRTFVGGAICGAVSAAHPAAPLLDCAIQRAGGASALRRARVLRWEGQATVFAGGRSIAIGVSTRVEPFAAARSDSWLLSEGPRKVRSLIIEPSGGWIERDGERTAMPDAMLQHERAQYALYGLMLLVTLREPGASASPGAQPNTLVARHAEAPDTTFAFDETGALLSATNTVPQPDGKGSVAQRFVFSGQLLSRGVRWPARIQIEQGGAPYFDLRLSRFDIERR